MAGQTDQLSLQIFALSSDDAFKRTAAHRELVSVANESPESRASVLGRITAVIEEPSFQCNLSRPAGSRLWVGTTQVLSDLKAKEDIDLLIARMFWPANTEHAGENLHHLPAIRALMAMGEIAVPKLSEALRHPDVDVRSYAAVCLSQIGGEMARKELNNALNSESNAEVRTHLKDAIDTIDRTVRQ